MKFANYENMIFDFDMTLADTSNGSAICYEKAFIAAGGQFDIVNVPLYMSEFLDATYRRIESPLLTYLEFETTFYKYSHTLMASESRLFPDTRKALTQLRTSKRLAIVTNKDRFCVEQILIYHGIPIEWFDIILCCDDVTNRKPHPEALNLCVERMNWAKEQSLYIGDNNTDLTFARNAGIDAVVINRNENHVAGEIQTLMELLNE